jgi:nicotinamidase-related amidase
MSGSKTALLLIDFINEIVVPGGKLAGKGYADFVQNHGVYARVAELLTQARDLRWPIFHVRLGFEPDYRNHPSGSPLFGAAKQFSALRLGAWGTEFADFAKPAPGEEVVTKPRVSAFYMTALDEMLRDTDVSRVVIAGCATDLAVQAAARDAHDRDYAVVVARDACAAASDEDSRASELVLAKIAKLLNVSEIG